MNKLSNKSIEKIKLFLADEEFSYVSLTRHEVKILFSTYTGVISLISEVEEKENNLIKYLEDKINNLSQMTAQFIQIGKEVTSIPEIKIEIYKDILERVKSGKYE